jgi:uncharacterized phage protein (TIGR01671 family)
VNREIKFRAWDNEENCWASAGSFLIDLTGELCWNEACTVQPPDKFTLMQYTGLKDKNGREIYEGDIVKSSNDGKDGCDVWDGLISKDSMSAAHGVKFDGFWSWEDEDSIYNIKYYTVIGNIYENPELLNATK